MNIKFKNIFFVCLFLLFVIFGFNFVYKTDVVQRKIHQYNQIKNLDINLSTVQIIIYTLSLENNEYAECQGDCGICKCGRIKSMFPEKYS